MKPGRKPIYDLESLEIGSKMEIKGKTKEYRHQFLRSFNKRGKPKFKLVNDGKQVFVERVK